ncbi:MAG: trypsin-like serine protease [Gaiellaceae bacterium]
MQKLLLMLVAAASAVVLTVVPAGAITGNFVPDNTHTYVGLVAFYDAQGQFAWRCTGSLLNSTTFLTAGHCTDQTGTGGEPVPTRAIVWVSQEGGAAFDPVTGTEDPHTGYPNECKNSTAFPCAGSHTLLHYGFDGSLHKFGTDNADVGMLILDTPVAPAASAGHSQYAQLPTAGLVDTLATGSPVTATGYGVSGEKPAVVSYRERLMASEFIINTHNKAASGFNIQLSGNPGNGRGGTCFGDSGGPILNGDSDVVLGVNSFVKNGQCAGQGFAYRVDQPGVLAWINAQMNHG